MFSNFTVKPALGQCFGFLSVWWISNSVPVLQNSFFHKPISLSHNLIWFKSCKWEDSTSDGAMIPVDKLINSYSVSSYTMWNYQDRSSIFRVASLLSATNVQMFSKTMIGQKISETDVQTKKSSSTEQHSHSLLIKWDWFNDIYDVHKSFAANLFSLFTHLNFFLVW